MSMPSTLFKCANCNYTGSSLVLLGDLYYIDKGVEFRVNQTLGWCHDCEDIRAIEYLGDSSKLIAQVADLSQELLSERKGIKAYLLSIFSRSNTLNKIDELARITKKLYLNDVRKNNERCLSCASINVKPLKADYSLTYDGFLYQGQKDIGFTHPSCGGSIIAVPNEVRFNIAYQKIHYSTDGIKI